MGKSTPSNDTKAMRVVHQAMASFKGHGDNEPTETQDRNHRELLKYVSHRNPQVREAVLTALAIGMTSDYFSWEMVAKVPKKNGDYRKLLKDKKERERTRIAAAMLLCSSDSFSESAAKSLIDVLDGRKAEAFGPLGSKFYRTLTFAAPQAASVLAAQFEHDHVSVCKAMERLTIYAVKLLPKMMELAEHRDAKVRKAFEDLVIAVGKKQTLPTGVKAALSARVSKKAEPVDWEAVNLAADECVLRRTPFDTALNRLRKMAPDDSASPLWDELDRKLFEADCARLREYVQGVFAEPPKAKINVIEFRIILPGGRGKMGQMEDVTIDGGSGFDPRNRDDYSPGEYGPSDWRAELVSVDLIARHAESSKISFEMGWALSSMIVGMLADRVCRDLGPELLAGGAEVRYVRYGYSEGERLLGALTAAGWQLREPTTKEEAFRSA
ncbi:MAG: hypothetical protein JXB13_16180 [Phycisphaerae bacterium]|nr:hypothetical protein [Phycisphaerae bacterium]